VGRRRSRHSLLSSKYDNYPYVRKADGLTSHLWLCFPRSAYVGIELEVNQRIVFAAGAAVDSTAQRLRRLGEVRTQCSGPIPAIDGDAVRPQSLGAPRMDAFAPNQRPQRHPRLQHAPRSRGARREGAVSPRLGRAVAREHHADGPGALTEREPGRMMNDKLVKWLCILQPVKVASRVFPRGRAGVRITV
jgi:hypothetical protein